MRFKRFLWAFYFSKRPCGSLWVIDPCAFLWVLMGPYWSLSVFVGLYWLYASLCVLISPSESL